MKLLMTFPALKTRDSLESWRGMDCNATAQEITYKLHVLGVQGLRVEGGVPFKFRPHCLGFRIWALRF